MTIYSPMLGKFSATISLNIFSGAFSLSSLFETPIMYIGTFDVVSEVSYAVLISFHSFSSVPQQ